MRYNYINIDLEQIEDMINNPDSYDLVDFNEAIQEIKNIKLKLDELEQKLKDTFIKKLGISYELESLKPEKEELDLDFINIKKFDKKIQINIDLEKI